MKPWKEKSHVEDFKTGKYEHFHHHLFKNYNKNTHLEHHRHGDLQFLQIG